MFDSLYINVKCPNCGKEFLGECQTKELSNWLMRYNIGDKVSLQHKYLYCNVSCSSKKCLEWEKKYRPHYHGFGYVWKIKVFLNDKGELIDKYEVIELPDENN